MRRVYDPPDPADGHRVLVDRLWPRGLAKNAAAVDEWLRAVAPSDELRRWYGHEVGKFAEFRDRYLAELGTPDRRAGRRNRAATAGPLAATRRQRALPLRRSAGPPQAFGKDVDAAHAHCPHPHPGRRLRRRPSTPTRHR